MSPPELAHAWYAREHDGVVTEVWIYGGRGAWCAIDASGAVVMHGSGDYVPGMFPATKFGAIDRALERAEAGLTRAQAAVAALHTARAAAELDPFGPIVAVEAGP